MEGKEKMGYVPGNKTNVTPVTVLQNGKPRPKPIKPKRNKKLQGLNKRKGEKLYE